MKAWLKFALIWLAGALTLAACAKEKWEYVSIGGDFTYAMRWNEAYAAYIEDDLGVEVTLTDVSFHSRKTLGEMLEILQTDMEFRSLVENAEVVTFDVPTESYLGGAEGRYMSEMCGGNDSEECFRIAHARAVKELRAYLDELMKLANPSDTIMRTFLYGTLDAYLAAAFDTELTEEEVRVFTFHADLMNEAIREIATEYNITVIDIAPYFQPNGPGTPASEDFVTRLGFTDKAVLTVADLLREAGYAPLRP
ncbi:MAG: SGNH/GDSL hydrolase family protein [Chloroflexi bacterium CFX1]|nr:MAG: SGNH/GDSL hydrolase family protein [Chloroflexota bacterium]MCC6986734.1 SGNH/GDSL hydrolase family protein [Anaerolineales bacterium]MCE7920487.1 SGNH/GDSL hydrolase family protein [Chloroflexi bacterium CFX1]MCQ3954605.1 hypothetical protein [Chloroflexota bacterium]MDL1918636.1 hypothetical protein [Chloroflexi bacterium CFX5]